jgi:hypothetical protein
LNVLVTRAREAVHLVTSIPETAYKALPPVPPGQQATGAYLLYAYLAYAEKLAACYANDAADDTSAASAAALDGVKINPTKTPSPFVESLAKQLPACYVYWGNDGLGIDIATHQPTFGILCDTTRFTGTDDPVQWDLFRTGIHESQGWKLKRVWTPHFYRDAEGVLADLVKDAQAT